MSAPYYEDARVTVLAGDCLDVLATLPDASVDAVVTDPPYSLSFMGRDWDSHETPVGFQAWCELWTAECLRVLKPGGHLLAFGGTRTWHRLACAVEDAGFEVRDSIAWMYGSGFPKSLDVSKAIDKARDDKADVLAVTTRLADLAGAAGITRAHLDAAMGTSDMGGWWLSRLAHRCACPSVENWTRLRDIIPGASELDAEVWRLNGRKGEPGEAWEQREVLGTRKQRSNADNPDRHVGLLASTHEVETITAPATDAARTWQGWGTALKPAFEPVVVARKPLVGTVAGNVLAHGTGALNVDGCRIETTDDLNGGAYAKEGHRGESASLHAGSGMNVPGATTGREYAAPAGRWPANVVLDESQAAELDQQSGELTSGKLGPQHVDRGKAEGAYAGRQIGQDFGGDSGGASRFFYVAKADAGERVRVNGTAHPHRQTPRPHALARPPRHPTRRHRPRTLRRLRHHRRSVHPRRLPVHRHRTGRRLPAAHHAAHQPAGGSRRRRARSWRRGRAVRPAGDRMSPSGWCSPCCSPRAHATCQERLDRGLLKRCDCAYHTPPTQPEDAA